MDETCWLGAGCGPAFELILPERGERIPLQYIEMQRAFDRAISRDGWIATKFDGGMLAFHDGLLFEPKPLRFPFGIMAPADRGDCVLYKSGSTFALVDKHGETLQQAEGPEHGAMIGEIADVGVVFQSGLVDWNGVQFDLPAPGRPLAIVGTSTLIVDDNEHIHIVDLVKGQQHAEARPTGHSLGVSVNPGSTAAAIGFRGSRAAIVRENGTITWFEDCSAPLYWIDDDRLLITVNDVARVVIDASTGVRQAADALGIPVRSRPRVDATGRFDLEELRSNEVGLHRHAKTPQSAAMPLGTSVRVDAWACLNDIPVGASRIGGQPDMPANRQWPTNEAGDPYTFFGQLRCDELTQASANTDVPKSGWLVFFGTVDLDSNSPAWPLPDSCHVEYLPEQHLERLPWHRAVDERHRFDSAEVTFAPFDSEDSVYRHGVLGRSDRTHFHQALLATSEPDERVLLRIRSNAHMGTIFGGGSDVEFLCPASSDMTAALSAAVLRFA